MGDSTKALPPLPEPGINTANHAGVRVRGYTAEQMREYAIAQPAGDAVAWTCADDLALLHRDDSIRVMADGPRRAFPIALYTAPHVAAGEARDAADGELLSSAYIAMRDAMKLIDPNEGPGREHSRVLTALAASRVAIENRTAALTQEQPHG